MHVTALTALLLRTKSGDFTIGKSECRRIRSFRVMKATQLTKVKDRIDYVCVGFVLGFGAHLNKPMMKLNRI